MELLPADYVLSGIAVVLAGMGLFRGFSGVFAFAVAAALAGALDFIGWSTFLARFESVWTRSLAAVAVFVLAFGAVRWIVKRLIGKILSQPSDAIFGCLLGIACAILLVWAVSLNPVLREKSALASKISFHGEDTGE